MGRHKKVQRDATARGTRAIIYLRVSGDTQVKEGYGLETQEDACTDYCQRKGYAVVSTLRDEAISGAKDFTDRPGRYCQLGLLA